MLDISFLNIFLQNRLHHARLREIKIYAERIRVIYSIYVMQDLYECSKEYALIPFFGVGMRGCYYEPLRSTKVYIHYKVRHHG